MSRRWLFGVGAAVILMVPAVWILTQREPEPVAQPNVILIVVDTLRADHTGIYGYDRPVTPRLEELAEASLVFDNAMSVAPWTTPSIAAMLTSRYPSEIIPRYPPPPLEPDLTRLPELFQAAGYTTGGIVAHMLVGKKLGFNQGFDTWDQSNARGHGHESSESLTDLGIEWVDAHDDQPFFLFLHYFDPHYAYQMHPEHDFFPDYGGTVEAGTRMRDLLRQVPDFTADDLRYVVSLYDSEIAHTDEHIGRFLDHLRARGLFDDALIVFTADHGEEFNERGNDHLGHTGHTHRELINVPLMIKLPRSREVGREAAPVSLIDLTPTLAAELDLRIPGHAQFRGKALRQEPPVASPRPVFSEQKRFNSVIHDGWKLMERPGRRVELYDLGRDPWERRDVAEQHPDVVTRLRELIRTHQAGLTKAGPQGKDPVFDEEELERLRALGYVSEEAPPPDQP